MKLEQAASRLGHSQGTERFAAGEGRLSDGETAFVLLTITGNVRRAYSREAPKVGSSLLYVAGLCFLLSYSPENAMHPPAVVYLYRSNQVSHLRGVTQKETVSQISPRRRKLKKV